ncbi:MAG: aminoglycoside phosphotransferase family protein [Chitinivibrionales bacterium]
MSKLSLTPAQEEFLKESLEEYDPGTWRAERAGQAGSERHFIRVYPEQKPEKSFILVVWNSMDPDWDRFLAIVRDLSPYSDALPIVYAADARHGLILEEDLGTVTLKEYCRLHKETEDIEAAYRNVIDQLLKWQALDAGVSETLSSRSTDVELFEWESDYFARHCVVEYFGLEKLLDKRWEAERQRLAAASADLPQVVMHRDFQSENILIHHGRVRFVDFQGARLGPAEYDLASLLYDPYNAGLDDQMVERLFAYYCSRSPHDVSPHTFRLCAMQRLLQALGAFGNLSIHKGKPRYRKFIPVALYRFKAVMGKGEQYDYIDTIVDACLEQLRLKGE